MLSGLSGSGTAFTLEGANSGGELLKHSYLPLIPSSAEHTCPSSPRPFVRTSPGSSCCRIIVLPSLPFQPRLMPGLFCLRLCSRPVVFDAPSVFLLVSDFFCCYFLDVTVFLTVSDFSLLVFASPRLLLSLCFIKPFYTAPVSLRPVRKPNRVSSLVVSQ